jgi:cytochrome b involved in lipid metabolism
LEDKVYDVSNFGNSHPGGEAVYEGCGLDATELFETRPMGSGTPHSVIARGLLSDYLLGDYVK